MPGTLRWIMNGITLMPAPTIEQTPVAVRPARPISRARRGSVRPVTMRDIAGFYPLESLSRRSGEQEAIPEQTQGRSRPVHLFRGRKRVLQAWPDRGGPGSQGQVDVGVRRRKRGGRHSGRARRRPRHGRDRARGNASDTNGPPRRYSTKSAGSSRRWFGIDFTASRCPPSRPITRPRLRCPAGSSSSRDRSCSCAAEQG